MSITDLDTSMIARRITRVGHLAADHFGEFVQLTTHDDQVVAGAFIGARFTRTGVLIHLELDEGNGYSWRRWFRCSVDGDVKVGRP